MIKDLNAAAITVGDVQLESAVEPGAKEVVFDMELEVGKTRLSALFTTADGSQYGAYYAYVRRK